MNSSPLRAQTALIRSAAVVQGLALVVIPTVSAVLTDPKVLGLSEARYGTLFLPQSIFAILSSLAGASLTRRLGARTALTIGFGADTIATGMIASTALLEHHRGVAYIVLLFATSFLGTGFAIVTPTLNVLAGQLEPNNADRAVLIVNALLGGSAAIAPLLLILFVGLNWWWGLPLLCTLGMLAVTAAGLRIPVSVVARKEPNQKARLPARLWLFLTFAIAYGICEQINGSWAPLYMSHQLAAASAVGSLALALFWGVATGARMVFAAASDTLEPTIVFRGLPFILALAFVILAALPRQTSPLIGVAAFAFAGLGVSALLPLVLSFCERSMRYVATTATSAVFAAYLVGYGIAAFGVGPLQQRGITIPMLDGYAAGIALIAAALSFVIVRTMGEHG